MSFDFSSLFWVFILIIVLQPLFTARWYALRRAQAIRAIEKLHETRVITMIHRQEKRSLFGFSVSRHIDLEDAQTIIAAIKDTPEDMPIDFVIHTPGGLVLAAMQIARALEAHKAKVTVYVPVYAMSGGTLIALAADEIVLAEFSVLGPIDPQIAGLPAASIVKARDSKPVDDVFDLTLVLADVAEKALVQVKQGAVELLTPRMERFLRFWTVSIVTFNPCGVDAINASSLNFNTSLRPCRGAILSQDAAPVNEGCSIQENPYGPGVGRHRTDGDLVEQKQTQTNPQSSIT